MSTIRRRKARQNQDPCIGRQLELQLFSGCSVIPMRDPMDVFVQTVLAAIEQGLDPAEIRDALQGGIPQFTEPARLMRVPNAR